MFAARRLQHTTGELTPQEIVFAIHGQLVARGSADEFQKNARPGGGSAEPVSV